MSWPVVVQPKAKRRLREQARWLHEKRSTQLARRWFQAADRAIAGLSDNPESRPLCMDKALEGLDLREQYFGAGRKNTHRLIFRVTAAAVEVLTVRSFAEDGLTPADL